MSAFSINNHSISTTPKIIKQYLHEETGRIHHIEDVKVYPSGFSVQQFTIMSEGFKAIPIVFSLKGENVELSKRLEIGAKARVVFQVGGWEWKGKYYNELEAKAVELEESALKTSKRSFEIEPSEESGSDEEIPF